MTLYKIWCKWNVGNFSELAFTEEQFAIDHIDDVFDGVDLLYEFDCESIQEMIDDGLLSIKKITVLGKPTPTMTFSIESPDYDMGHDNLSFSSVQLAKDWMRSDEQLMNYYKDHQLSDCDDYLNMDIIEWILCRTNVSIKKKRHIATVSYQYNYKCFIK